MDAPFPFGFPAETALYLAFYVATLVVHVAFMSYVLAGTALLAKSELARRFTSASGPVSVGASDPLIALLRDWLPVALSAAITAGIAPLLFVQVLYQRHFYTANLLLFHRWMLVVPALIVGFYLLYALKTRWLAAHPRLRVAVAFGALACFAFTGLSWTENYLLAKTPSAWAPLYESGSMIYRSEETLPRLALWVSGAFPVLALLLGFQLAARERRVAAVPAAAWKRLSTIALAGLAASAVALGLYVATAGGAAFSAALGPAGRPYIAAAALGVVIQIGAWTTGRRADRLTSKQLGAASVGVALTLVGTTVGRELVRIASIDFPALYGAHREAARASGVLVFLAFLALNVGLSVWAIRTALRRASAAPASERGAPGSAPS